MATSFVYGATTVTMDHNPLHARGWEESQECAFDYDSAGAAHSNDNGAPVFRIETLIFPAERWSTLQSLLGFMETTVGGGGTLFTWNDRQGASWTARYKNLAWQQIGIDMNRINLTLEVQL